MGIHMIEKFTDETAIEKLEGGQNESFKVGNYVFKPVSEPEKYIWIASIFEDISPDSVLISKPIKSKYGNYIEEGYGVTEFIPGTFHPFMMREKLEAAHRFHKFLSCIEKPDDFNEWTSPWTESGRIAWGENELPKTFDKRAKFIINSLLEQIVQINLDSQLIHSDLSGNILFNSAVPLFIDFSPDFRPLEYAHTILVTDSIAWNEEPLESLDLLQLNTDIKKQLVLRAIVFRICVPLFFDHNNFDGFINEFESFKPLLDYMEIEYLRLS